MRILDDRRGYTLIYVTITFGVLLAAVGISLDTTRLFVSNTDAQAAADAAAVAAAYQLDKTATAITRAQNAAMNTPLVSNDQTYGETATPGTTVITSMRFLTSLPASDDAPITDAYVTTNPALAEFVEVTTETVTHKNSFLPVLGADGDSVFTATAVAGKGRGVCKITPMFICNPNEAVDGVGADFDPDEWKGRLLIVKASPSTTPNSQWAPGNWGFLDNPEINNTGSKALGDMLAKSNPPSYCYSDKVNTRPGAVNSVRSALNVRMDIYGLPFFNSPPDKLNYDYRPSVNVTKGYLWADSTCPIPANQPGLPFVTGLPVDSNQIGTTERFGNGDWKCLTYWNANHKDGFAPPGGPGDCSDSNPAVTRYDVYRYEIDNNEVPGPARTSSLENGAPYCYQGTGTDAPNDDPDRRVLQFAVGNCLQHNVSGNSDDVPVLAYIKAFMTKPVGSEETPTGKDFNVYWEVIGEVEAGADDDVLKEWVQIYR